MSNIQKPHALLEQISTTVDCKQLVLIVRTLNYHAGMQNFTIVFITDLKEVNKIDSELTAACDSIQIAVCGLQPRHKGKHNLANTSLI